MFFNNRKSEGTGVSGYSPVGEICNRRKEKVGKEGRGEKEREENRL